DPKHVANPLDWFHDSERKHSVLVLLDQELFQTTYQDIATSFLSEIPLQREGPREGQAFDSLILRRYCFSILSISSRIAPCSRTRLWAALCRQLTAELLRPVSSDNCFMVA